MPQLSAPNSAVKNRVLERLPPTTRARVEKRGEMVEHAERDLLYESGGAMSHAYFPVAGVLSLVVTMEAGTSVEVATVGNEAMLGTAAVLGAEVSPVLAFAQVPGASLRVPMPSFLALVRRDPRLRDAVHRAAESVTEQSMQSTACAHLHGVEQRLCRWLLMTHDRVDSDSFPLTQDFLAQMLGVRRASVNVVAGMLQRAGLIVYSRGTITVLSRSALEAASCECYRRVRRRYEALFD
jgi:CRP-like cAMP-binding protein